MTIVARYSYWVRIGMLVVFFFPLFACGERLFKHPTAYTLLSGEHRVMFDVSVDDKRFSRFVLESGVTLPNEQFLEFALNHSSSFNRDSVTSLDVQYGVLQPITGYVPGCAIGITGLLDDKEHRPSVYAVLSYQFPFFSDWSEMEYARLSAGVKLRGSAFFVSVMSPLYKNIELISEWEQSNFVVGVNWRISKNLSTRVFYEKSRTIAGIYFCKSF